MGLEEKQISKGRTSKPELDKRPLENANSRRDGKFCGMMGPSPGSAAIR